MKRVIGLVLALVAFTFLSDVQATAGNISQAQLQEINQLWQKSAHALAEVNCSSCHQDSQTKALVVKPTQESCQSCHEVAVETFLLGKHGIRIAEGLTPLTPAMAHLPMKKSALGKQMTCNTCHDVHSVNTFQASVDSCLSCHNDSHSLNYKQSKHAQLFVAEGNLPRPSIESVTCATCHLPRQEFDGVIHVNHNNTYNLLPRDRMVQDVCMNCHGMEYSYNSIFDDELVETNFARPPTQDLKTLEMIRVMRKKRSSKDDRS
ncbi:MAG: cytochrome c3 family protein [Xenococcaceae cyanobacterium]